MSVADEPSLRTRAALARFLSALISVESSAAFLIRELDLARSILVEIGRGVADQNAIDAMGSEEALHIAVALADCAVSLGDHLAQKLARAIVTAVASRMLGSGAIPAGVLDRGVTRTLFQSLVGSRYGRYRFPPSCCLCSPARQREPKGMQLPARLRSLSCTWSINREP